MSEIQPVQERSILANAKKVSVAVLGSAALKYRDKVQDQQEVLAAASDIVMDIYAMESAILRTEKLVGNRGEASCSNQIDATRVFVNEAIQRIERHARTALAVMSEGDEFRVMLATLRRLLKFTPTDVISARRRIADSLIKAGKYNLS